MIFGAETENKRKKLQLKKSFTKKYSSKRKLFFFFQGRRLEKESNVHLFEFGAPQKTEIKIRYLFFLLLFFLSSLFLVLTPFKKKLLIVLQCRL